MAMLRLGENLEVGGFAGPAADDLLIRGFEIVNGDTVMARTHIARSDGSNFRLLRTFDTEIVDLLYRNGTGVLCLSGRGDLVLYAADGWSRIADPIEPRARVSQLLEVAGQLYAVGPDAGAYRLAEGGTWTRLPLPREPIHILDMAADGPDALLLAGTDGYLVRLAGEQAERLDLATDAHLCAVASDADSVYVAGYAATLYRRQDDAWELLDVGDRDNDFLQFVRFDRLLLLAAEYEVLSVDAGQVTEFAEQEVRRMSVVGDYLFGLGVDTAVRFDGADWSPVEVAFDVPDEGTATAGPRA